MADNVTVDNGLLADYIVSADEAASGQLQRVKLAYSADGVDTHVTADGDGLLVNLGTNNDVTVTGTVAVTQSGAWDEVGINDSGNSITVDAPVGSPVFVRLSDGAAAISTLPVSLASVPSHPVTNAGTFAVQATLPGLNVGAFGDLVTANLEPIVQLDFVYGINTQTGTSSTANSATVDTTSSLLRVQSGTNSAGTAQFSSRRPAKYRPGQGVTARFTTIFTTGTADSTQIVGMGNATDGYFVGYNGATFGMLHRVRGSDSWVAKTAWNGDKLDGSGATAFTLDPTRGNVWQIVYPYLGFGAIRLYALDPSGSWLLAHTIRYPNSATATQLSNPNLPFLAQSSNSGATANKTVYVGSVGVFLVGKRSFIGSPRWSTDSSKTTVTTEQVGLNLRNATTYNGVANRSLIRLNSIGIASTANNGVATVRLKFGATTGGTPSWSQISGTSADNGVTITAGNSIASVDTAGTTSSGTKQYTAVIGSPGSQVIDLTPFELFVAPGEDLAVTVASTASTTVAVTLNWSEDI